MDELTFQPIGVVHSPVGEGGEMPIEGVAANFDDARCTDAALAVHMMYHIMFAWRLGVKDASLQVGAGEDGCIADALQGLSGPTVGSGLPVTWNVAICTTALPG
jgi:hypothetical protein